eukprot:CAMPEP_0203751660 /NCGR_PEP_ID=MMETSP0098-20131031/5697_1 /ASSEMBLY_ACC=CAM_ASM_000208 /TAXON_ID=96639 /ORGANISM=" , Strain NY0313808BC1" /LENGTH=851 /DNA_ID=CAMNT_0050641481 /DNA_START=159 /DNA_END=2717 /DNA_ORIENTATION=-
MSAMDWFVSRLKDICCSDTLSDSPQSDINVLGVEVRRMKSDVQSIGQRLKACVREKKGPEVYWEVKKMADGVLQAICNAKNKAKELRLGGSCSHGADKGPKCTICFEANGRLSGPYVKFRDGLELGEYLYLECRKAKKRKRLESGISIKVLGGQLDRISSTLREVEEELRQLDRNEVPSLIKLLDIFRVVSKAEMTIKKPEPPLDPVRWQVVPKRQSVVPKVVSKKKHNFRRVILRVNNNLVFKFCCFPKSISDIAVMKSEVVSVLGSKAVKRSPFCCAESLADLKNLLSYQMKKFFPGTSYGSAKWFSSDPQGNPQVRLSPDYTLRLDKQPDLHFACTMLPSKQNIPKSLQPMYILLRSKSKLWSDGADIKLNGGLGILLNNGRLQDMVLEGLNLTDNDLLVLVSLFTCTVPTHIHRLGLQYNKIVSYQALSKSLGFFTSLRSLSIGRGVSGLLDSKKIGALFKAIANSPLQNTLVELDVSYLQVFTPGCLCGETNGRDHLGVQKCNTTHATMRDCAVNLGAVFSQCKVVESVCMDGMFRPRETNEGSDPCAISVAETKSNFEKLASSIESCGSIRKLSLQDCTFRTAESLDIILRGVLKNPSVEHVNVTSTALVSGADSSPPQNYLGNTTLRTQTMCFSQCSTFSNIRLFSVFEAITAGQLNSLKSLDISKCALSQGSMKKLLLALSNHFMLRELNLNHNPNTFDGDSMVDTLCTFLGKNKSIVTLQAIDIGVVDFKKFFAAVFGSLQESTLENLQLGSGTHTFEPCQKVRIEDLVSMFDFTQTICHLRLVEPHRFVHDFQNKISTVRKHPPPLFENFTRYVSPTKTFVCYKWGVTLEGFRTTLDFELP